MKSAYYANKIPNYLQDIYAGKREVLKWNKISNLLYTLIKLYNISEIYAYNARFDCYALRTTQRFLNGNYMLPYKIEWCDIWKMAKDTICKQKAYKNFCDKNNFKTSTGRLKTSAEAVYAYINYDILFQESHTGLEDVIIEANIMAKCFSQHKPMRKNLFQKNA